MLKKSRAYLSLKETTSRTERFWHEDNDMFGKNKQKQGNAWFPGQSATRDRWGDPIANGIDSREFKAGSSIDTAARMRWSLGHA